MFEVVELGRNISKSSFKKLEAEIRVELLELQRKIEAAKIPVILIVSGVEGAGKSDVVNRLNEWLDTRGIETYAFWDKTDEEAERPRMWRFWRAMPPRGKIGIMFGSWYTQPIVKRAYGEIDTPRLDRHLARINELERMLTRDGALIVKLWFHITRDTQSARIKDRFKGRRKKSLELRYSKHYDEFSAISEHTIRHTDTGEAPWHLIEAEDPRYRDIRAAQVLTDAINNRLHAYEAKGDAPKFEQSTTIDDPGAMTTILDRVDLSKSIETSEYRKKLDKQQKRLQELSWQARNQNRSVVSVFEGWDAGGKGGAIRRITAAIDARLYRVISVAAPTDEEKNHHYLWRFWRHIPRAGYFTIYDRSWYGRVLVERVEGFAEGHEWQRSFQEINDFESQLTESGIILNKYWLHISPEEQLRRFKEREQIPWKQHKITDEDWRNRDRWDDYTAAINDMIARTSTANAPWHLIPANDKRYARVQVIKTLCDSLEKSLDA